MILSSLVWLPASIARAATPPGSMASPSPWRGSEWERCASWCPPQRQSQPPNAEKQSNDLQQAAQVVDRRLQVLSASNEREIDAAFKSIMQQRIGALAVTGDTFFATRRHQIVALAAHYAVPAMYQRRDFTEIGGLISYGTDFRQTGRQSGSYVGRILKGEKPSDLPVLQPTKFELVINLKTAKALGLDVPDKLLALADEVIE